MPLPVTADSGDVLINSNSAWHMHTTVTLNPDGTITGSVHSRTTNGSDPGGQGFHAAVVVTFSDSNGKVLYQWSNVYGVSGGWDFTGPHDRTDPIGASIPAAEAATVAGIGVTQTYDPQFSFLNGISHFLSTVSSDLQQFIQFCTNVYNAVTKLISIVETIFGGGTGTTGTGTPGDLSSLSAINAQGLQQGGAAAATGLQQPQVGVTAGGQQQARSAVPTQPPGLARVASGSSVRTAQPLQPS